MNSHSNRSGLIRLGLLSLLGLPLLAAIWLGLYAWVERSARDLIYNKNAPEQAISKLEAWSPWMLNPSKWSWLKAEGYRKLGDRSRVSRLVDEMTANGIPSVQASSPLLLLESASGCPSKSKTTSAHC